jgi:hypothetical protein
VRREQIAALNERADASDLADLGKKNAKKKGGDARFLWLRGACNVQF